MVPSQPQTPCRCGHFILISAGFIKNFVAFILCAPQGLWYFQLLCNVSVVTRFMCVFFVRLTTMDFNRPVLHILYAQGPLWFRSRSGNISLYWTAFFVTGLALNGSIVWTIIFKNWGVFFFYSWMAHYCLCKVNRAESSSTPLELRPVSHTTIEYPNCLSCSVMQRLSWPCLALQTVEHYVLCPTLSCSLCSTPGHASQLRDVFNNHRIFWVFRQSVIVPFSSRIIFVLLIYLTLRYLVQLC